MEQTQINRDFKTCRRNRREDGFSLVEVMISLAIFSIGMLAVFSLHINSIKGNTASRSQTESVLWCQDRIEQLMLLPYDPAHPHEDLMPGKHKKKSAFGNYWVTWNVETLEEDGETIDSILMIREIQALKRNQRKNRVSLECIKIARR